VIHFLPVRLELVGLMGLLLAAGAVVQASPRATTTRPAPKASYSGRWALDLAASDLGKRARVPRTRTDELREDGAWMHVRSVSVRDDGDTLRLIYSYREDGEAVNTVAGQDVRTRGRRERDLLRFESVATVMLMQIRQVERWSLSPDRNTFTIARETRSPLGNDVQRLLFRRTN